MRDWWQPRLTLRTALLLPLSALFAVLAALRRTLYRSGLFKSQRLPVPVVVVGNLTVGGSGKTPAVIALAQALAAQGWRPGIISRGYKAGAHAGGAPGAHAAAAADAQAPREVRVDSSPSETGDEPLLIKQACPDFPVFVGRKRPAAGRALLAAYPQVNVLLTDDGLQHYALARDVEIAVFDARGAGNGHLLPAGPLREPLSRQVDAIVINGDVKSQLPGTLWHMQLMPQGFYRLDDPTRSINPREFAVAADLFGSKPLEERPIIAAVAGIGNPQRFFATLRKSGLRFEEHPFADHHAYTAADLAAIRADLIVMTEKDAIKCASFNDTRVWVLPVAAQLEAGLIQLILEKIRGPQTA